MNSDIHNRLPGVSRTRWTDLFLASGLALLWIGLRGLPVGVGNQGLHLVFLEHLRNPDMFARDPLVKSLPQFTTWFFHILAGGIPSGWPLAPVLQALQVVNTGLLFFALTRLTRTLFPNTKFPALALLPLFAAPLQALAETPFPPLTFSHSALGLTLALFSLNAFFRRNLLLGAALLGLLANVHLITAATTAAVAGLALLLRIREIPIRKICLCALVFFLCAVPILPKLLHAGGEFDAEWLTLLRLRSPHHVFPSSWWRVGDASWGLFLLWMAWLALFLNLTPAEGRGAERNSLLVAPLLLMVIGTLGSELWPVPVILRAQLFRASLWPLLLVFCVLPAALEQLWRLRGLRLLCGGLVLLFLVPGLRDAQVWLLLTATLLLLAWGLLRPSAAAVVGWVLVITTLSDLRLQTRFWSGRPEIFLSRPLRGDTGPDLWTDIQNETRERTPTDARILTPSRRSGFRRFSQRSIVGEWRDGTMQFFDPDFAREWEKRMRLTDPERVRGYQAAQWVDLAASLGADHLVLPANQGSGLVMVTSNAEWALYKAELIPLPPLPPAPENAKNPEDWLAQERFMLEVVEPNILKNRSSEVLLRLLDTNGHPLVGAEVSIQQISRDFGIGSALHHFAPPAAHGPDFRAPRVHPRELERFLEVFNYSVIGFSGKWISIEPREGERNYEDLDQYVDWCVKNGIRIEFHFVSGYVPEWIKERAPGEQQVALQRHAKQLIDRYGARIDTWQVVNERHLQNVAAPVFELFRQNIPGVKLGVSHCARFYSDREGSRRWNDMVRGWDSAEQLIKQGATVDFFAVHAHRPFGTWWDPRTMYEVFDDYAAKGVRVHITETGISHAGVIEGSVLSGEWNEALQADYLRRFLSVCYSHPNVDVVNFWGFGPRTWQKNIGLLDENYEPRPAFEALRKLVQETWLTRVTARCDRKGEIRFRGFHGDYRISVRDATGRSGLLRIRLPRDLDLAARGLSIEWATGL